MNTAIYYFSGTGNSLSTAQTLQKEIPNCELHPIVGCLMKKPVHIKTQRIGIVFPIHFMNIPRVVREFLNEVIFEDPQYTFVVVTGANPKYGNCLAQVKKLLSQTQVKLNAGFFVPSVAAHFPYFRLSKPKPNAILYKEAKQKALAISKKVNQCEKVFDVEFSLMGYLKQWVTKEKTGNEGAFFVNEGCIRCGYCMQTCPFQNIRLHGKQVQWLGNCHYCFACLHYCSKSVIEYKKLSAGKARQHHPSVLLNDISLQRYSS